MFCSQAKIALRFSQEVHALTAAVDAGTTLGRASGVVMERQGIDAEAALAALLLQARKDHVTVVEAAETVLRPMQAVRARNRA